MLNDPVFQVAISAKFFGISEPENAIGPIVCNRITGKQQELRVILIVFKRKKEKKNSNDQNLRNEFKRELYNLHHF